ncbi:MAG: hypothetical protein ACI3XQ_00355 [Eubacteriales bacterium]
MVEAIITGAVAIVVCMINNIYQHRASERKHNATIELLEYKFDQLSKKVDLHNNVVVRMYAAEKEIELQGEKIKVANKRIADLEKADG